MITDPRQPSRSPELPRRAYLDEHGVDRKDYNSGFSPRQPQIRGFASPTSGCVTSLLNATCRRLPPAAQPGGPQADFVTTTPRRAYTASFPLVVFGGGTGRVRHGTGDRGSLLLACGRSPGHSDPPEANLIGVIPLRFPEGKSSLSSTVAGRHHRSAWRHDGKTQKAVRPGHQGRRRHDRDPACARRSGRTATAASCIACCAAYCQADERPCPRSARTWRLAPSDPRRCAPLLLLQAAARARPRSAPGDCRDIAHEIAIFHHFPRQDALFFALARRVPRRMAAAREGIRCDARLSCTIAGSTAGRRLEIARSAQRP